MWVSSDEPGIVVWLNTLPFSHFSISALTLTYYYAQNWRNASHGLREPMWSRALKTQFSLSLYCLQRLYSVMSRRGSNDQWLSQSSKQAGQMLILPSATHVSVILSFEGESSTAPLTFFFASILYFVICFQVVSQPSPNTFSAAWGESASS